jgi:hypothetical protein
MTGEFRGQQVILDALAFDTPAWNDRMVETMMTADGLRLTAYGPDQGEVRIAEVGGHV